MPRTRAPTQQVHPSTPKLCRAAAGEHEPQASRLDEILDLIQQARQLLDLIDDDGARRGRAGSEFLSQPVRLLGKPQEYLAAEKVKIGRLRKCVPKVSGLPRLSWSNSATQMRKKSFFPHQSCRNEEGVTSSAAPLQASPRRQPMAAPSPWPAPCRPDCRPYPPLPAARCPTRRSQRRWGSAQGAS